jgi:hypothetical protein
MSEPRGITMDWAIAEVERAGKIMKRGRIWMEACRYSSHSIMVTIHMEVPSVVGASAGLIDIQAGHGIDIHELGMMTKGCFRDFLRRYCQDLALHEVDEWLHVAGVGPNPHRHEQPRMEKV